LNLYYLLEEHNLLAFDLVLREDGVIAGDGEWMIIDSAGGSQESLGSIGGLVLQIKAAI
jgi:hypothetical protein